MNLAGLEADLYRRAGFSSTPDAAVVTRFRSYLNQVQREIMSMKGLSHLRRATLPFASVANDPFAVLPTAIVRIVTIVNRAGQVVLTPTTQDMMRDNDPGLLATSAVPYAYAVVNLAAATALNPVLANLSFKSTSAADGATKQVFVEFTSGGIYQLGTAAMNGVTAVNLGVNAIDGVITKFYIALVAGGVATASGTITLHEGTTGLGTQLGFIGSGQSYARYSKIQLFPTPSTVVTYHADVELHIQDMAQASDEPYLPEDYSWLLVSGALMKEFLRLEKHVSLSEEKATFKNGLADLKLFVARASQASEAGQPATRRFSSLGGYFPAGS